MPHLLIRQKTTDYAQWQEAFDSMTEERAAAGLRTVLVSRNQADPDELVVLFEVTDQAALKEYLGGDGLKAAWERGRVIPETNQATFLVDR